MAFDELKQQQAHMWGAAPFEKMAATLEPVYDVVLAAAMLGSDDRWLDVGCGTGELTRRGAAAAATTTGLDLSPALVETARAQAAASELDLSYEVGDVEALPYADASFDVVTSSFAAMFAPDHVATARELGRVCRADGRLVMTTWLPRGQVGDFFDIISGYAPAPPPDADDPMQWGDEDHCRELLGSDYHLTFSEHNAPWWSDSAESMFDEMARSLGPLHALLQRLPDDRAQSLRSELIADFDHYRTGASDVTVERRYLLISGVRR